MERERYPSDWNLIAKKIREDSHWQCQGCSKPYRKPGESIAQFEARIAPIWTKTLVEMVCGDLIGVVRQYRPKLFVLTVAHLDQDPENSDPEKLKALCAPCHLRYNRRFREYNRRKKREGEGQLNLFTSDLGGEQV